MARTGGAAMMTIGIRRDGKATKREYMKRYRRTHRKQIRAHEKLWRQGRSRRWWSLACFKAGVPLRELDL